MKEGRVALRAGDPLDHLDEVIGPLHADRLRTRLSQTDVFVGDRIEYDFDGEGSSLSIVSDNYERAIKYFDDLNKVQGDDLFAELVVKRFEGDSESLVRAKEANDARDAARFEKAIAYFAKRNGQVIWAAEEKELPGEGWLRFFERLPFKRTRAIVRATVADMRAECAEAPNREAREQVERDGRVALFKIVGSVVWDLLKGLVAFGKVVREIRKLIG